MMVPKLLQHALGRQQLTSSGPWRPRTSLAVRGRRLGRHP
jgi:hypothetical protein